jgi:cytochrome c553
LSVLQTRDRFFAPDWHPDDHVAMPEVVALGRKPDGFACGFCHRADGPGEPENASLAGLPAAYIVHQMADMKNGSRKSAVPERGPPQLMIKVAKAASEDEVQASAAYFAALKPRSTITVVETDTVPKTFVAGSFLADAKSGEKEPLGNRSSKSLRISCNSKTAMRDRALSLMCRRAASRQAKRLRLGAWETLRRNAPRVTGRACKDSERFRHLPAARRAISSGNSMTSSTARAPARIAK